MFTQKIHPFFFLFCVKLPLAEKNLSVKEENTDIFMYKKVYFYIIQHESYLFFIKLILFPAKDRKSAS